MKVIEYDISHPYEATVIESERITPQETDEVRHLTLSIPSATFTYVEGQSIGVLVPGPHEFGNEHHLRLYSIANARQGENNNLSEISICVRRCFYIDEVSGEKHPGVASNYLCDQREGDTLQITGPYGRQFTAPRDATCNLLMIGVGTGIAPFRAFIKHIYEERGGWDGKVRLFYGAKTGMDLLYMNDRNDDLSLYYDKQTFRAFEAVSPRPAFDAPADIGAAMKEQADEIKEMLEDKKTHLYVSGLSKLEDNLDEALSEILGSESAWQSRKAEMKSSHRWATLFYD